MLEMGAFLPVANCAIMVNGLGRSSVSMSSAAIPSAESCELVTSSYPGRTKLPAPLSIDSKLLACRSSWKVAAIGNADDDDDDEDSSWDKVSPISSKRPSSSLVATVFNLSCWVNLANNSVPNWTMHTEPSVRPTTRTLSSLAGWHSELIRILLLLLPSSVGGFGSKENPRTSQLPSFQFCCSVCSTCLMRCCKRVETDCEK
mmetsp:Transcript_10506/g.30009  ORF Transcript_10506/g.30009 Transcript_10506/m.30009 type:complete len:202 (-) Transcript_10506:355-960(-)